MARETIVCCKPLHHNTDDHSVLNVPIPNLIISNSLTKTGEKANIAQVFVLIKAN